MRALTRVILPALGHSQPRGHLRREAEVARPLRPRYTRVPYIPKLRYSPRDPEQPDRLAAGPQREQRERKDSEQDALTSGTGCSFLTRQVTQAPPTKSHHPGPTDSEVPRGATPASPKLICTTEGWPYL